MARYALGLQKATITVAGAVFDVATAATDRARILEIGIFASAATGTTPVLTLGLFRSTAVGTRTTPTSLLPEDAADGTATTTSATAWSVAPTLAATPLRRFAMSTLGSGIIWTWPTAGGLSIPVSGSLVVNAITVAGTTPSFTVDGYVIVDE